VRLGGRGPQVDLMVMPPEAAGTHLIHFTGSKEHNVRLRAMARDLGWSLSEYGFARLGEDGEIITDPAKGGELRTFPTEAEAYAFLGLPFRRTCMATSIPTRTGPTARSRSRSWRSSRAAAGTPTR
jgi:DNA polymerase/3'-5' exonuclease PolX